MQSTLQQVGGALGLALPATLTQRHELGQTSAGVLPDVAATDGFALSLRIAAVLFAFGAVLVGLLLERMSPGGGPGAGDQRGDAVGATPTVHSGNPSASRPLPERDR